MNRFFSLKEIDTVAQEFLEQFSSAQCIAFDAEMGAGKTTFICALGKQLGIQDPLSSPTFSIINEYVIPSTGKKVYHMDWYRLKGEEDAIQAGVQDILDEGALCFIEWPSVAENLLPPHYVRVQLKLHSEHERELIAQTMS